MTHAHIGLLVAVGLAGAARAVPLKADFKAADGISLEGSNLVCERTDMGKAVASAPVRLPANCVGRTVRISVRAVGANLSNPKKLKVQLSLHNEEMEEAETISARIDSAAAAALTNGSATISFLYPAYGAAPWGTLSLGFEHGSGRVAFDLDTLAVEVVADLYPQVHKDWRCVYTERVTRDARRRGCMLGISPPLQDGDFRDLAAYGANVVRYQMWNGFVKRRADESRGEFWERWLGIMLDNLETNVLVAAEKYGFKVAVDLHDAPGGRYRMNQRMFYERDPETGARTHYFEQFTNGWARIARRFRGNPHIYGYDLYNEPLQDLHALGGHDCWSCNYWAAKAIREIDHEVPIIVECGDWDNAKGYRYMSPIPFTNVIYSLHFYCPHAYTHQGVGPNEMTGPYRVAAKVGGVSGGPDYLRRRMACAKKFSDRFGAKMFVGEFSVVAWAPGADEWLENVLSIFEEYGWDWTYHAFREWPGWSFEWEGDSQMKKLRRSEDNPRKRVLLKYFRKNRDGGR